jgi:hypothetical protein
LTTPDATAFGVRRVDTGNRNPHTHLARAWLWYRYLTDLQHLACGSLALIPGGAHLRLALAYRHGLLLVISSITQKWLA